MLEGFKAIVDRTTLRIVKERLHDFHMKLLRGERLTEKEEENSKLFLWGIERSDKEFRDDKHRIQLIEQWQEEAKLLDKRLKEQEEKPK